MIRMIERDGLLNIIDADCTESDLDPVFRMPGISAVNSAKCVMTEDTSRRRSRQRIIAEYLRMRGCLREALRAGKRVARGEDFDAIVAECEREGVVDARDAVSWGFKFWYAHRAFRIIRDDEMSTLDVISCRLEGNRACPSDTDKTYYWTDTRTPGAEITAFRAVLALTGQHQEILDAVREDRKPDVPDGGYLGKLARCLVAMTGNTPDREITMVDRLDAQLCLAGSNLL